MLPLLNFTILMTVSGCVGTSNVSNTSDEAEKYDIAWLEKQLQAEGIFASPSGPGNWSIPASSSVRLVLDGSEAVNVYLFENHELASSEAWELSNELPQNQVYRKEGLVIVRSASVDTGLSGTLRGILGNAL